MTFTNNYSYRPNEERISKLESIWGIQLPKEYRKFLMKENIRKENK